MGFFHSCSTTPEYAPDYSGSSSGVTVIPPPPSYEDSSDSSNIPNVIKVDSNVILMKPGNSKQEVISTNLAEKEKELQLELDILDTKQKIAAINDDTNRTRSITSMDKEISKQPRENKRDDGIELLIDTPEDNKKEFDDGENRSISNSNYDNSRYDKRNDDSNTSSSDSNTKQIRI